MHRFLTELGSLTPCAGLQPPVTTYCFSCLLMDNELFYYLLARRIPADKLSIFKDIQHTQKKLKQPTQELQLSFKMRANRRYMGMVPPLQTCKFQMLLDMWLYNSSCWFSVSFKPHNVSLWSPAFLLYESVNLLLPFFFFYWNLWESKCRIWSLKLLHHVAK